MGGTSMPRRMRRIAIAGRRVALVWIALAIVGACGQLASSRPLPSFRESPAAIASVAPTALPKPSPTPEEFPAAAYADISEVPIDSGTAGQFQALLEDMAGRGGIAATVMTTRGTWSGAAGTADGVHRVELESQFGIASITKSVVAAQVMQLVEAHQLSLDAPAKDVLPADFPFDTNGATIRQLLDMRSGIPDWFDDAMKARVEADRDRIWELDEVLALLGPGRHPAGGTFEYADTNYNLLGLVIENVRKRPLIDVLRHGVLRVKGTERLIYQPDEAPTDPMAMPLGESRNALDKGGGFLPSISDASSAG